jgi:hypothetical protein
MIYLSRSLRNIKEIMKYPFWILKGKPAPDNHLYKIQRIRSIGKNYFCDSFIETGTFYGQTINSVRNQFNVVHSIELYEPLYQYNKKAFSNYNNVTIHFGDSSSMLKETLKLTKGRILFWLDGHFSGAGTACGNVESPILAELEIIKNETKKDHCILIDDVRSFTGTQGYPTREETIKRLLEINPKYQINIDCDCIIAIPPAKA